MADLYMTINPNDAHSPIVCKFAGEKISISLKDPEKPTEKILGRKRHLLLAQDPYAAVLYSHCLMQAFLSALLGYGNENGKPGLLGHVAAYHFNPEEQNRGSLHYHGL